MGRNKTYDRQELVERATELFRDHGYAGTSTQMLVDGLGVNRYSVYAEFGDKNGVFEAVLAHYNDTNIEPRFAPLEAPGAGLDEIRHTLEFYSDARDGPAVGRGCLLCNTAIEFGPTVPSTSRFVDAYFARLSRGFRAALTGASQRGELRSDVDPDAEAEFLMATVLGIFVMLRGGAASTAIEHAVSAAIGHLDSLMA